MSATTMLNVTDLRTAYGSIRALHGLSFSVAVGSVVIMLGPNGAGKSTTLKSVVGLVDAGGGTIEFLQERVEDWRVARRIRRGMAMVPESREVFPSLSVRENLSMGAFTRRRTTSMDEDYDLVYGLFPRLKERDQQLAGTLSGGEQQQLAIGRALMSRPRLLLLDEPSLGLAPQLLDDVYDAIVRLKAETGVTILLVEQNANMALSIADYGYVLESGRVSIEGTAAELSDDPRVKQLYLGG